MKNAMKKIVALLIAVVMIIGVLPVTFASDFTDVADDAWYAEYVDFVYNHDPQLMNGVDTGVFDPDGTCTRAMAAVVLYRLANPEVPTVSTPSFTDLDPNQGWYWAGIAWAEENGIVNGVGDAKFDPNGLVTREQLVTMIWRFAGEPTVAEDNLADFADADKVSDWAKAAFNWAISKGIIGGTDKGDGKLVLDPQGNATRAQFAKIVCVYDEVSAPCVEHTWDEGVVTTEPTCDEDGEAIFTCTRCGETEVRVLPALGHDYVDGVCSRCGDTLAAEDDVVIYYTNDIHTYIDKDLSYDSIADLKAQTEAVAAGVLLVDAGDHAQGTAFGGMDKGQTIIELMNAAGYDYATLGNHEFDYGMDGAMNFIEWADFTYLSSNFYHEEAGVRGENVLDSYAIVELGGHKVALVGITTPESFTKSTPAYFQDEEGNYIYGISGGDDGAALYADVQAAIDAAKAEGAEIIIALGHLGDDPASDPWNSEDVISNTTGLDAFIDGHSHSTVEGKLVADKEGNEVLLTQTGQYFDAIGKMTIDAEGNISTELITSYTGSDESVAADVEAWITEVDELLGEVIATSEIDFIISDDTGRLIRKQETNLGDFCADALYYLFDNMDMDVDVAIMNGGGIRANMPAGDISYKTTKTVHTFGNVACLQTITGQQLLDALEWGARNVGTGENGGFLQVSGVTYEIHSYIPSTVQADDKGVWCGAPTGEYRVKNVTVGGEPLDLEASYNLAGYNYTLRDLGDGFAMFDGAVNVLDYVMEDYLVLANYAKSFPEATIKADNSVLGANYGDQYGEGRITIVPEKEEDEDDGAFVLSNTLEAGDEVVIVCAAKNMALSSTYNGYYNAAVAVAPADGKLVDPAADLVWTVGKEGDYYTFSVGGQNIGMGASYASMPLGEVNDTWQLMPAATENCFYLFNVGRQVYMEYYEDNGNWSGYYNNSNEELFALQFYVKDGSGIVDPGPDPDPDPEPAEKAVYEKVTSDLGNWEGTYVVGWDDGTNALIFNGETDADGNNVASALTDNKVTAPTSCAIVITAVDGGYTLKATGGYLNGKTYDNAPSNGLKFETEPSVATIVWTDGNPIITSAAGTVLRYNNGETYDGTGVYSWFRFFKVASSVQTPINLYKLTDEEVVDPDPDPNPDPDPDPDPNPDPNPDGEYVLTNELADGDKVVIYNPAQGMALSSEIVSTYYKAGAAITPVDGKVVEPDAAIVWTVTADGEGFNLSNANGEKLSIDGTYNSIPYDKGNDAWSVSAAATEGCVYVINENGKYISWSSYGNYSAYNYDASKEADYALQLYVLGGEAPCEHDWDDGEVTTAPSCLEAGIMTYTCTLCGATKTEEVAALGHNDADEDNVCDSCDAVLGGDSADTTFADLKDGDTIVIVMHASAEMTDKDYVLLNNFGQTPAGNAAEYTGEQDATMYWTVKVVEGGIMLYANGTEDYLYTINANNGLRVGTGEAGYVWTLDEASGYLTTTDVGGNVRYLGVYDNNAGDMSKVPVPNFRVYKNTDGTLPNIADQTIAFYKIG